jgi:hypothetical protein
MTQRWSVARRIPAAAAVVCTLFAAGTQTWEMNSYSDFVRGKFEGVALTRDGRITAAPKMERMFASDQPVVWAVAQAKDGTIYAGTGHRGRVFRVERSGKSSLYWSAEEPEIFALAVDSTGALYAATSPDGRIYRILEGKASEYFAPKTRYIWSLAVGADGALYAGTGDEGKIFRITAPGAGEVWYETGQAHVTSLALDTQGRLLAGSEPNGMLYRITGKSKAFVLYDANLPEIRAIAPQADGTVYAAALGGSVAKRTQSAAQGAASGQTQTPVTTISVTVDAAAQSGVEIKPPPQDQKQQQAQAQAQAQQAQAQPAAAATVDLSGVEKSAVYRINPDNTVETLWSSKEENAYDLLVRGGQILFPTDQGGRVYKLTPERKLSLVAQTNEGEAIRLLGDGSATLIATSTLGKIYRLEDAPGPGGWYESPVHDATTVARWGRIEWRGEGGAIAVRTRSGNSQRPDATWSDWSEPLAAPGPVASPNARYIQWKAELRGAGELDAMTVAYLPQNNPPAVKSVTVATQLSPQTPAKTAAQASASGNTAFSVTVSDTPDAAATATSAGTPAQMLVKPAASQMVISWQAEDPDGDRLLYSLYFRGDDEREWKLLKADLRDAMFTLDAESLADGRYRFRVVASDRESNASSSAREAELVSAPVQVDNTPPVVTSGAPRRSGNAVELDIDAADASSPLRRCEYSIDAGAWTPLAAADGVIDSQREKFTARIEGLAPGEHVVTIRAVDSTGNVGTAKVVLR